MGCLGGPRARAQGVSVSSLPTAVFWLMLTILRHSFDAVRHFSQDFVLEFISHLDETLGKSWFFIGEYWKPFVDQLEKFLSRMDDRFWLFDAPLVENFFIFSRLPGADLTMVFDGSLVQSRPRNAVTLVMNHDTQPGQAVERIIADFFKPLAYALILLRVDGYPCVFYGDLYGIKGHQTFPPSCSGALPSLILARKLYAYGEQTDYFDKPNCIGWTRSGTHDRRSGCAVVMSNGGEGRKKMFIGKEHRGEVWTDVLAWSYGHVKIEDDGWANFRCQGRSVSVWVNKEAAGRDKFGKLWVYSPNLSYYSLG